ncbi:hypothetical protein [Tichowtungia aerotolerans]|uniref:Uncharacterized protein n=1 Tax=Tichowtungia aerotolerans TaxID=2697043 RepID=A0A6P1M691_9BACT|nr:hypothetical protein [Tichowtungia aerotolerans]QHI69542.1 hypothetical protein GT409_08755 [Tichowtungia aerotolerans]
MNHWNGGKFWFFGISRTFWAGGGKICHLMEIPVFNGGKNRGFFWGCGCWIRKMPYGMEFPVIPLFQLFPESGIKVEKGWNVAAAQMEPTAPPGM